MKTERVPLDRLTWRRFRRAVTNFANCDVPGVRWRARGFFGLLIGLLLAFNGLNVLNSYVGRDFITAISNRDTARFTREAFLYLAVFAGSAVVGAFYSFSEQRLGLLWREWLTGQFLAAYLRDRAYYRLTAAGVLTNPDERITEDVRAFTTTTLSFVLLVTNAALTVIAFSGVLWSISPALFAIAVSYAACGSVLTVLFGRPLVWLNYNQLDREADFRANLVHVHQNAESIALLHREQSIDARLRTRLADLVANMRRIITVNRQLAFFTNGYNYLIQIIPALVVAPLFIRGEVEFGVITQSTMAFSALVGALSLVVTQFQSISSFAAVIARLGSLADALDPARLPAAASIDVHEDETRIAYEELTLLAPDGEHVLVKELSVTIPHGTRVVVGGQNEAAKVALFRATAGMWQHGRGTIVRPALDAMLFLPERPYVPPGTLRNVLVPAAQPAVGDDAIAAVLEELGLHEVVHRIGGLDVERDWDDVLSLGEQQLFCVASLVLAAPRFAFLERPRRVLGPEGVARILGLLADRSISYVTLGDGADGPGEYDAVLDLGADGAWSWKPTEGERRAVDGSS